MCLKMDPIMGFLENGVIILTLVYKCHFHHIENVSAFVQQPLLVYHTK